MSVVLQLMLRAKMPRTTYMLLVSLTLIMFSINKSVMASNHAKRLYEDLLKKSGYNKFIRPVINEDESLRVNISLRLSQLIEVVSCYVWYFTGTSNY